MSLKKDIQYFIKNLRVESMEILKIVIDAVIR